MSDFPLPNLDLKETGVCNEDGAQLILQAEAWFQSKMDQITQLCFQLKSTKTLNINDMEITDPQFIKGFSAGLYMAVHLIGEFPLSINGPTEEDDE